MHESLLGDRLCVPAKFPVSECIVVVPESKGPQGREDRAEEGLTPLHDRTGEALDLAADQGIIIFTVIVAITAIIAVIIAVIFTVIISIIIIVITVAV